MQESTQALTSVEGRAADARGAPSGDRLGVDAGFNSGPGNPANVPQELAAGGEAPFGRGACAIAPRSVR